MVWQLEEDVEAITALKHKSRAFWTLNIIGHLSPTDCSVANIIYLNRVFAHDVRESIERGHNRNCVFLCVSVNDG